MLWRCAAFALAFAILQLSWQQLQPTVAGRILVDDLTVGSTVAIVNTLTPAARAHADGSAVRAPGGGINIINGCDGTDALFLLMAAFVIAPLSWRRRVGGLLLGLPVVFVVNELRILVLFYSNRADHALFDVMHATVTPVAVIILVAAYFYSWLAAYPRLPQTR